MPISPLPVVPIVLSWSTFSSSTDTVVPGLLQRRAYASAMHQAREMRSSGEEIEGMAEARIRRAVGEEAVMAEQMDHLHDMAQALRDSEIRRGARVP
ncbi:Scr1 family TA system antitoxin-like transcriptional regulator [Streptomyces sp. NPDC002680]|uniref:Scr1 family TA system antitoxin-like transcriptional regulator n=1 Tax=Streptomyces sp. NPDC002680 TaxID=3364659 RepID=UPI00368408EA